MNIIYCCQKSVFIHTGSSSSYSRARWVPSSTFFIVIPKIPTNQSVQFRSRFVFPPLPSPDSRAPSFIPA